MSEVTKVQGVGEWIQAVPVDGYVQVELGFEPTPDRHEYTIRMSQEAALEFALRIAGTVYEMRGVDVQRMAILINPEVEEGEETKPEDLPS